ncbi:MULTISPECIES: energy transducer TonB [Nostocales]|uniref:Energy transducer TonB n=3 Tax=Nostocales TaxID=1161 RepID=A0A0C1N220_9CYAN|nr:energy transducer TonB [Tolypothrix bouteillei]KAF3883898.1 energy transducer TonB [Tolypothrix bouteillei VB521301]
MKLFLVPSLWLAGTFWVLASTPAHSQVSTKINIIPPAEETGIPGNSGFDSKILEQPKSAVGNGSQFIENCTFCNFKYPEIARQQGMKGTVEMSVEADDVGNVTNVRLIRSSGYKELDASAIEQVRKLKLAPQAGGRQDMRVKINYEL